DSSAPTAAADQTTGTRVDDGDATSADDGDASSTSGEPYAPWAEGKFIPPDAPTVGDPAAGEWALLHEGYVSCGIPYDLFQLAKGQLGALTVPGLPIAGIEELARFVQRYKVLGPAIVMYTVGTNPADEVAVVLANHRDRDTLAWLDEPQQELPDIVAPVDTPPWWRVK